MSHKPTASQPDTSDKSNLSHQDQPATPSLDELLHGLFQLRRGQRKRNLDGVKAALSALPYATPRYAVQVVGTNGKGATASFLAQICRAAGLKTGLFTSPHLHHVRERFAILDPAAEPSASPYPSDATLAAWLTRLQPLIEQHQLAFFDVATLVAACLFSEAQVDVAIYEAGIGGRLDATSAIPVDLTILTNVGRDHQAYLGESLAQIAADKGAAFRPHKAAISGVVAPELRALLDDLATQTGTSLWHPGDDFAYNQGESSQELSLTIPAMSLQLAGLSLPLYGEFQRHNAALAATAACRLMAALDTPKDPAQRTMAIRSGLAATRWPGRLQPLTWQGRQLWLDGAHNEDAAIALARSLPPGRYQLVYGAAQDKDIASCMAPLLPRCAGVYLCSFAQPRAASKEQLMAALAQASQRHTPAQTHPPALKAAHATYCADVTSALQAALDAAAKDVYILVTGSLFVVAEALEWLGAHPAPPATPAHPEG